MSDKPPKRASVATLKTARDFIVHQKLLVTRRSGAAILKQISSGKPTKALRDLMRDGDQAASRGKTTAVRDNRQPNPGFFSRAAVSHPTEAAMRRQTSVTRVLTIVTLVILGLAGQALAAGGSGFNVNVLVDDAPRAEYHHSGSVYIEAVKGASYSLRLTNPTPYRVAVALSVDGLNTIDAKHTDPSSASKWVLEPYESTVISGWQVSNRAARSFYFTNEQHSYGASLGQTQNLGVIEAVYFRERQRPVSTYSSPWRDESSGVENGSLAQPAPPAEAAAPSAKAQRSEAADDYAATGMGHKSRHEVESVDIDLESAPVASVRIRYEFRPQLVKLGILPEFSSPLDRRERASGFSQYCPQR